MSPQAFTPRICATGENTGDVLGDISAVSTGSLISPFNVCAAPPPFGEAVRMPMTPPPVGAWYPNETCVVREDPIADRPPAGCIDPCGCRFFWATDTQELWYDDCTEWVLINGVCVTEDDIDNRYAPCTGCRFFWARDEEQMYFANCEEGDERWVPLAGACVYEDTLSNRPEPCEGCDFFWATDTEQLFYASCGAGDEKWVLVGGGLFDDETALQLGTCADSADADEEPDAPTDCSELAWDITNQTEGEDGLIVNMLTRLVYQVEDDGGSEILYGYCRSFGFDTSGRLVAVSEECDRIIIDEPEPCTGSSSSAAPA